jgi:triosephosphate isomerase (TIM)
MRIPFIAGNWKMNLDLDASLALARELKEKFAGVTGRTIMIAPNFTALHAVGEVIKGSNIALGAQNMSDQDKGAFTGEVAHDMLKSVGVRYVILGHSERRTIFGEKNDIINRKVKKALAARLKPILCVGEMLAEREGGRMEAVVKDHVFHGLIGIDKEDLAAVTIAYEPVWAIGTGKTATPQDADAAHIFIRKVVAEMYDETAAEAMVIQYGGSVNDGNIDALMTMENIDGALVGGAALKSDSFARIVKYQ